MPPRHFSKRLEFHAPNLLIWDITKAYVIPSGNPNYIRECVFYSRNRSIISIAVSTRANSCYPANNVATCDINLFQRLRHLATKILKYPLVLTSNSTIGQHGPWMIQQGPLRLATTSPSAERSEKTGDHGLHLNGNINQIYILYINWNRPVIVPTATLLVQASKAANLRAPNALRYEQWFGMMTSFISFQCPELQSACPNMHSVHILLWFVVFCCHSTFT